MTSAATVKERPRGATPRPRSGAMAERSHPVSEARAVTGRSNPMPKKWHLHGHRMAKRSYTTFKIRRGGCEEITLLQGKEQRLCFAGAAVKRYPHVQGKKTQVRR